mmetsp:Transcript_17367/g.19342  ORF Transcript_17367/g.19342 Transcript_17367/m.19342 type:complete len:81 (-) Transcript_17367:564-806(-)
MKRHNRRSFLTTENSILLNILESSPQFYLEGIANKLYRKTGKRYNNTTMWRQMTNKLGYSLQLYIFLTRQAQVKNERHFD